MKEATQVQVQNQTPANETVPLDNQQNASPPQNAVSEQGQNKE